MAEDEYAKKMGILQQYIPFLDNMIQQLKDPTKKNREQQLAKMQSLHAMITDKKKKLKLETLVRCEDVISKLYEKVHNRPIGAPKRPNSSPLVLTPASPSPPRDIIPVAPLTIPTERIEDDRQKVKIDVYSSAAESLNRPKVNSDVSLNAKVPDMSKPPISLEDLKTLEDDVQDKINEKSLQEASLSQLNDLREMISEQIQIEDKKSNSPQKSKRETDINTTVRNNMNLTKITVQSPEKPKSKEKVAESVKPPAPSVKSKILKLENDSEIKKDVKEVRAGIQINIKPKVPKILKEPASIFGSILSNIDEQIIGQKKKEERRNSIPGKEDRRLSDSSKEKSSKSHEKAAKREERRGSIGKQEKKSDDKKTDKTGTGEKNKSSTKEMSNKEKYFSLSGKQSLEEQEKQLKEKLLNKYAERLKNEATQKDTQNDSKDDKVDTDSKPIETAKDETVVSKISVKKDLELKTIIIDDDPIEIKDDVSKTTVYKRLADKYNPKPRKQASDTDLDKSVADRIEENMKTSPPKIPQINKMPEPVPPPQSLLLCSESEPEIPKSTTHQLPAVLQNILNPSTTQLINTVVSHLRQTNAENEARKSPMMATKPSLLGTPPAVVGNPSVLITNLPAATNNVIPPLLGNSPSIGGTMNLLSPPVVEDNFVSEYCRDTFNFNDNNFNKQTMPDFTNNRFTPSTRPESRMRYEQPQGQEMMGNQLGQQNARYMPSGMGERFNEVFMPNRQAYPTQQAMPDMYSQPFNFNQNHADMQSLDYYPPNAPIPSNQYNSGPPLLSPEVPHYHNEQKPGGFGMMMNNDFFGHNEDNNSHNWRNPNDERFHWGDRRDQDVRVNRDPRTYREYREMREARDPRVSRDARESRDSRDPRINRDPRDRDFRDREFRDPRLNRSRDPREERERGRDRERSVHRESRSQSRDYRPSRYDSKFDRIYSRTNRDRSRSRSRSRPRETFTSPLDSLYSGKEEHKTGKGYGVQNFRIPKIKKEDDSKEKEEETAKVSSTNEDLVEAADADTGNNDDVEDNDVEQECMADQNDSHTQEGVDAKKIEEDKEIVTEQEASKTPAPEVEEVKETQPVEPEPPKVTSSEPSEPEGKPADQTILAHFFANLLGSRNKRDKKTALYSLISTFSDSFSEKELSKITKIIKANDDDDDSSEEEEESKKITPKADEETPKEDTMEVTEKEDEVSTPKSRPRRRIMRITSNSPSKEDKNEQEPAKSTEPLEPEQEESGVIVSVGERIKNRKRNSTSPTKPRKKTRTELDMLHEDIQDMFIRDGVLTASGKRMCRMLKDDPNVLSAVQESKEGPNKLRRRPMPKCKQRGPNPAEVKVMKSVRVVIPKMLDKNSSQKEELPRRNLRRSARNVAYAESDDESLGHEDTSAVDEDSLLEDENLRETESGAESSDSEREKSPQPAENQKSRIIKRKRGKKSWASGVLPTNKRKKKKQASLDESEETPPSKEADKTTDSIAESDADKSYVEPDKNYYIDVVTNKSHHCRLCSYHGRFITTHYKTVHPESEILTSRFSPAVAEEAIKDSEKNLAKYESLLRMKGGAKIQFICRFCEFNTSVPPTTFYDHITTHTGEYRHICPMCDFSASSGKTLKSHMLNSHNNEAKRVARKTYSQTIKFGYMCGECHYVQLSKTNVEEHINIFHLQKPTIYKINMSTYLDPEIEKIAQEEQESESGESREEVEQSSSVESKATKETKQKKTVDEEPEEEKKMPPPQYKKRGPKPGPRSAKKKAKEAIKAIEEVTDSDSVTDNESVTSKDSLDSRTENSEAMSESIVCVGKRRIPSDTSLDEEVSPVRSRRAAKDKATEKLKTLMEATEGLMRKRYLSGDDTRKVEEKKKTTRSKPVEENSTSLPKEKIDDKNNKESQEMPDVKDEEQPKTETKAAEEIKADVKKEIELNVFTCKTDLQEENKKIEQERLQLMDELNKTVGSRTSLNFVDKLCDRLNQPDVVVKEEPRDEPAEGLLNRDTGNNSPLIMPTLHKEKVLTTPTLTAVPSTSGQTITPNKKPVLEPEESQIAKSSYDVVQKNDKIITDMIQKLKGKLKKIADSDQNQASGSVRVDDVDYDSEGPPPLTHVNELVNVKPADASTKTLLIGGFVKVIRNSESLMFSCLVPPCMFSTGNKDAFQAHCKEIHKQSSLNRPSTLCELCGMEVIATVEYTLLENLFRHVIAEHADFINNEPEPVVKPPTRVLRIRKLSGDALSVPKKDWDEVIPASVAVDHTDDDVEASAATADKEETDKENQNSFNVAVPSVSSAEVALTDDQPATMVELDMSDDNPFPFKISGVMSLAEQPQLPPLALIAPKPAPQLNAPQLIVKEAKLTKAELQKPRKTAKAMAKFITSVSDLYKCPHYYCLFSTNFRDFLERHLKAHKVEQDIMIPCVYCDMKTPWEHVPMHIDIRHAHCRFACSYCLYRAVRKEYVFMHQDQQHPANDYSVIALPQPKHSKKFAIADLKIDPRNLCEPYRCLKACNMEFLFENEFKCHLMEVHKTNFIPCGYKGCTNRVQPTKMSSHWALAHGVCVYQCGECRNGSNELVKMYHHFSQSHPGLQPNILIRILSPMQEGVYVGYSAAALKVMRKVVTLPSNIIDHTKPNNSMSLEHMSQADLNKHQSTSAPSKRTQMVTPRTQAVQKSLLLPTPKTVINRTFTLMGAGSPTTGAGNILVLPSSSSTLTTIVMSAQSPTVTSVAPSTTTSVNIVPSVEPIPSTSAVEATNALPLPEKTDDNADAITDTLADPNQDQTVIAPLEHITVGDDGQMGVEDGDLGDIDPLSLDADLNDVSKNGDADSSGDESDGSKAKKQSKIGLLSYQLYRCAFCDISFSNSVDFKKHAAKSLTCRRSEGTGKQFVCVHCGRKVKNAHVLGEHIQCHGVWRFSCSLCSNKYPTANQARSHVKTRHNINQTVVTPVNPDMTNPDTDEYVVRPKLALQPLPTSDASSSEPSANSSSAENVYTPDQIDKIPMRHILSASIRCGLCSYNTKVRTNMVRHLQFHLEEKDVSASAPVNPVPCLEKNEKMFDKMVNLASSSHATSRMGGANKDGKEKEAEKLPEFVSTHCRYVCPAQGCNYLCPEEANLRHHIIALHDGETSFTCVHCKADLSQADADNLIKHFKLHGRQLYKCPYCSFVHHFKHKAEKHAADAHLDLPVKVVTVRCLESEPVDPAEPSTSGTQAAPAPPPPRFAKPWRCCMCKYKNGTQEGIHIHVLEKHDIDSQFKCALCTYKSNDMDSFAGHFKEAHDGRTVDIIYAYRKLEDKEKENEAFDTTPLWQRDRPRVRHIRGILFDESSPVVPKSPKKAAKAVPASPGPSGVKAPAQPGPSTSKNSSVDLSIESVINGTADILHDKPSATIAEEFVELVNRYAKETGDYLEGSNSKGKDDDDVIVIEDDEDKEAAPMAKNKDNKNAPVAKNRPSKRKAPPPEVPPPEKAAKVTDEVIDLESAANADDPDEFSERNLRLRFAPYGTPLNRQLKCPVCNQFKSKRISDFIFHMYKEMKVYRFKCKICADESITFRYMYRHVQDHNDSRGCDDNIIFLAPNRHLEMWLQMVIREQSLTILQNFHPTPDEDKNSVKKTVACPHCDRKYSTEQERNEHSIVHWSLKPFSCKKCKFSTYNYKVAEKHVEDVHRYVLNVDQHIATKAPTVARELRTSDRTHMREVNSIYAEEESGGEDNALEEEEERDDPLLLPREDPLLLPRDGDLRESDLVIVSKEDSNVPDENDVFCCEYCPFMANSEALILSHITSVHEHMHIKFKTLNRVTCEANTRDYVACTLCDEAGTEIRVRQHHIDCHDGQTFVMYRYTCAICRCRFLKTNGLKLHFKKMHPGAVLAYSGLEVAGVLAVQESRPPQPAPTPPPSQATGDLKSYKCPVCSYQRVFRQKSVSNVRSHVKQHFKAYGCRLCPKLKFKTRWEAISHFSKEHRGLPEDISVDPEMNEAFNEAMAQIVREAKPVARVNTARKSTSAAARRPQEEYSFYGGKPEDVDMAKITTAVEINGMTLNMTADKLSKIFDLEARVLVEDCNLPVNLSSLFDS